MPGSLLICQQISASEDEIKKITSGSYFSPDDLIATKVDPTREALSKQLSASLATAQAREERAKVEAARAQKITMIVGAGSLLVAAGGLYLSWRSSQRSR